MRRWLALPLLLALTACGGHKADSTSHFAATARAAYAAAEASRSEPAAWETFALTVANTPAGSDAVQRAQLVAAARHEGAAYQARRDAISCTVDATRCPAPGADDTDRWAQQLAEIVRGL